MHIHDCSSSAKADDQYAVTVIVILEGRGVLDAPPSRGMTRSGHKKSAGGIASGGIMLNRCFGDLRLHIRLYRIQP